MSGAPDPVGAGAHRATQEQLPWLLNGTLAGADLEAAEAHLRACATCRADLAALRRLREAGRAADPPCDPERALAQLLPRLDGARQAPAASAASGASRPSAGLPAANDARWLRRVALAQGAVIVLLAALLAWPGGAPDTWRALGDAPADQANKQAQAVVVFRPDTSERELRRIVRAGGARIVGGPTLTDAYVLAVPGAQSGAPLAALLARLRAEPAVLLAEPLGQEGRP